MAELSEMGHNLKRRTPSAREVEQAIVALKKGAHLLKCGRRGKPKFRPFRLSTDEKRLIWYSGEKEKHLNLNVVSKVVPGQQTVNFLRHNQMDKKLQSFSLVYNNGERSLDLICKDKEQAESWCVGLMALLSASGGPRPLANVRSSRWSHSYANSPVSYTALNHKPGFLQGSGKLAKVRSLYGSPARSLLDRNLSDSMLDSGAEFYPPRQRSLSDAGSYLDKLLPPLPQMVTYKEKDNPDSNLKKDQKVRPISSDNGTLTIRVNDGLKDVFIWGQGVGDILGGGIDLSLPKILDSTDELDVQNISCGEEHAALVTKQGEVFCWGVGNGGRLGHKVNLDVPYPKIVESITDICVETISCGAQCTFAITKSGELYAWGDSSLGLGLSGDGGHKIQWFPHRVSGPLDGICVSMIASGKWHTAIITSSGSLFTYGDGTFGVLGHGDAQTISQPKQVESLKGLQVKSVACGPWHTAAVVEIIVDHRKDSAPGSKLFTWGDNDEGRLGHPDKDRKFTPTCVASLVDHDFLQVSCGTMLTVALTVRDTVFTMGSLVNQQSGNPQSEVVSIARVEGLLEKESVKEISAGSFHVVALTTKGKVYTWGRGGNGQLGLGDIKDRSSPALVEALDDRHVDSIACGSYFTVATCLHTVISGRDALICKGCRTVFGIARKKHNCYNCGFMFCHSCSSKKATNASLAPDTSKKSRVCDTCFGQLRRKLDPRINLEIATPRALTQNSDRYSDLKIKREQSFFTGGKPFLRKLSVPEETKLVEADVESIRGKKQNHQHSTLTTNRWGHVPCPLQFLEHGRDETFTVVPIPGKELSDVHHVDAQNAPAEVNSTIPRVVSLSEDLSNIDELLREKILQLQLEAISLTQKCQSRSQKLQKCKRKIEETWLLAKNEAEKFKASNAVTKILTNQINILAEKLSARNQLSNFACTYRAARSKISGPECDESFSSCNDQQHMDANGSIKNHSNTRSLKDSPVAESYPKICATKESKDEEVEQVEVGVYITFISLSNGQKDLKRVRFSRKNFSEKEAEIWWEKNQKMVYSKYNIAKIFTPIKEEKI